MSTLECLEPRNAFLYFEEICNIPHGSGNVSALVDYCVDFAEKRKLSYYRDDADNIVISKPGSKGYENADIIILQGHTDMVCEKEDGLEFDFTKDPIKPYIDGDFIRAKGTTLGGDNGIAVAMCLAILDDESLSHPPLEVLFTSDEETGMVGAFAFDCSHLKGHKLINLDSEYEGVLMCSCAGGANANSSIPVERATKEMALLEIKISGLKSGHSGIEIDKGRANANVLMTRILNGLFDASDFRIVSLSGGSRETAIAAASTAVLGMDKKDMEKAKKAVEEWNAILKKEYASSEPGLSIEVSEKGEEEVSALTVCCTKEVIDVLISLPDSVIAMSMDMPGLVQTSINFGILELRDDELYFANTARSSMTSQKMWVLDKVKAIVALAKGKTEITGNYPGWSYNPNSVLKDTILNSYKKLFGKEAKVDAVHAGIECGLFADSIENLDCVSIGPEMAEVHTPKEHFSISSVKRTYELLCDVLKESR